jgi:uncharacterized membrane protein YbhN (UPF0104 family)
MRGDKNVSRSVWAWLRTLAGAGIIAVLVWRLGSGAFLDGLRVISPGDLMLAFSIGVTTTVFSAWRWCLVARGLGMRLSLRTAVADYYKALFLNAALPCGVLGDVDRAVSHGRDSGDVGRGVRAVVLLTVPSPVLAELTRHGAAAGLAALVAGVVAVIAFVVWVRVRRGESKLSGAARTGAAELRTGLLSRRNWPGIVLASTIVLAGHLGTFVVAARAAGSGASLLELAPLMLLALLAMSLPVNIGGWGPREGVTAWAFGAAGLSAGQGLTIAVAYGLFAFVAALPGAIVLVVRAVARMRRARAARIAPVSPAVAFIPVPRVAFTAAEPIAFTPAEPVAAEPVLHPLPPVRALAHQGA